MASDGSQSKKPDLISIYRLEFYKNKEKWKFGKDKKKKETQQSREPSKTKSSQDLNKTHDVETICAAESETSPLNSAFMHDIPTDDTPENVPSALQPTPQSSEKMPEHQETESGPRLLNTDTWVNIGVLTHSETHQEVMNKETLTDSRTDAVQQSLLTSCIDQYQPVSNLQSVASNKETLTDSRTDAVQQSLLTSCIDQYQPVSNIQSVTSEWSPTLVDIPNCDCREERDQIDLQYSAVDQNTLKPQGSLDGDILTPQQIRQWTDHWLRRFLALYGLEDDSDTECETASDQTQDVLNDSTDFIREAHEVPHSSEKDPNETREWVCWCLPPRPLPALSSGRLSAALQHFAQVLREVLKEQLIRDRLRSLTLLNVVEYPTRDRDLFGNECVIGGSHVPHCTRDLEPEGERVIRIHMGRPYRL